MKKIVRQFILFDWFVFVTVLFCLPGSAFSSDDWLDKIWFDKWVHIGIFAVLVFLALWAFLIIDIAKYKVVLVVAAAYGLSIEIIQDQFISNRAFDWGDLVADVIGSLVGIWAWGIFKKNRAL